MLYLKVYFGITYILGFLNKYNIFSFLFFWFEVCFTSFSKIFVFYRLQKIYSFQPKLQIFFLYYTVYSAWLSLHPVKVSAFQAFWAFLFHALGCVHSLPGVSYARHGAYAGKRQHSMSIFTGNAEQKADISGRNMPL